MGTNPSRFMKKSLRKMQRDMKTWRTSLMGRIILDAGWIKRVPVSYPVAEREIAHSITTLGNILRGGRRGHPGAPCTGPLEANGGRPARMVPVPERFQAFSTEAAQVLAHGLATKSLTGGDSRGAFTATGPPDDWDASQRVGRSGARMSQLLHRRIAADIPISRPVSWGVSASNSDRAVISPTCRMNQSGSFVSRGPHKL